MLIRENTEYYNLSINYFTKGIKNFLIKDISKEANQLVDYLSSKDLTHKKFNLWRNLFIHSQRTEKRFSI